VWIAGVIVILDQAVKLLVRSRLTLYESITVIPGLLDLTRVHNTGTAFGFMNLVDFPFKTLVVALMAARRSPRSRSTDRPWRPISD